MAFSRVVVVLAPIGRDERCRRSGAAAVGESDFRTASMLDAGRGGCSFAFDLAVPPKDLGLCREEEVVVDVVVLVVVLWRDLS